MQANRPARKFRTVQGAPAERVRRRQSIWQEAASAARAESNDAPLTLRAAWTETANEALQRYQDQCDADRVCRRVDCYRYTAVGLCRDHR